MSQGRLEGLELGVPAACFGQRFCAWGARVRTCRIASTAGACARRGISLLGPEGSAGSPYMSGNGEGSLVLSIVGVRLGLRYAKALHARLGAWSPHQQPPGMLQRRLPAGSLSAFSTLSRRRIDVAFT
ncbi:uncharacterized protein LOC144147183 [Haemaphysalis longicornis]